jgi:hypothetical protein
MDEISNSSTASSGNSSGSRVSGTSVLACTSAPNTMIWRR